MSDTAKRAALVHQFEPGRDLDETHELYHDDAVLEFPQSGERFVGKPSFLTWRKQYPAAVDYRLRRITGHGDLWVVELNVSYNGSPPMFGVSILCFRGERIVRESIYVTDGFDPSPARSEWATSFDRLASVAPEAWTDGVPFGIDAAEAAATEPGSRSPDAESVRL